MAENIGKRTAAHIFLTALAVSIAMTVWLAVVVQLNLISPTGYIAPFWAKVAETRGGAAVFANLLPITVLACLFVGRDYVRDDALGQKFLAASLYACAIGLVSVFLIAIDLPADSGQLAKDAPWRLIVNTVCRGPLCVANFCSGAPVVFGATAFWFTATIAGLLGIKYIPEDDLAAVVRRMIPGAR